MFKIGSSHNYANPSIFYSLRLIAFIINYTRDEPFKRKCSNSSNIRYYSYHENLIRKSVTVSKCNNNSENDLMYPPKDRLYDFSIGHNAFRIQTVNNSNLEDLGLLKRAYVEMIKALDILASGGWQAENTNHPNDVIESKFLKGIKILRVKAVIDMPPATLVTILYDNFENQPHWNPSMLECRIVKTIDNNTDISHMVSAPACQGLVTSRDFAILRHRTVVGQSCIISSVSIDTHLVPINKSFVRAEIGPSCFVITPIFGSPNKCELRWLLNTNLNGWVPMSIINMALTGSIEDFLTHLRQISGKN